VEIEVMRLFVVATVFIAAMMFDLRPAPAGGVAPWCAVIALGIGSAYWDCQYPSVEACRSTVVAGNRGFCNPNPAYYGPVEPGRRPGKRRYRSR
jgi:hypothetical protein